MSQFIRLMPVRSSTHTHSRTHKKKDGEIKTKHNHFHKKLLQSTSAQNKYKWKEINVTPLRER